MCMRAGMEGLFAGPMSAVGSLWGDKSKSQTTDKLAGKLSKKGQGMGFGPTPTYAPNQVETRAARQGSALLN